MELQGDVGLKQGSEEGSDFPQLSQSGQGHVCEEVSRAASAGAGGPALIVGGAITWAEVPSGVLGK